MFSSLFILLLYFVSKIFLFLLLCTRGQGGCLYMYVKNWLALPTVTKPVRKIREKDNGDGDHFLFDHIYIFLGVCTYSGYIFFSCV